MQLVRTLLCSVLFGAAAVYADGASIMLAMRHINDVSKHLNITINQITGALIDPSIPKLLWNTRTLKRATKIATRVARTSANLTPQEAFKMSTTGFELVETVNETMESFIRAAPKLKSALPGPMRKFLLLPNLRMQRLASGRFSEALLEKTPEDSKDGAKVIAEAIDESFAKGIAVFL